MQYPIRFFPIFLLIIGCKQQNNLQDHKDTQAQYQPCADKTGFTGTALSIVKELDSAAHQYFRALQAEGEFNGGMVVAYKGCIVFEKYHGLERLNTGSPMNAGSALHIASVSKTFTAMAVLKLRDEGKLNLDDPVSSHLPMFDFPGVTIRHLLNHRSGLPNYVHFMESIGWDRSIPASNVDILKTLISRRRSLEIRRPDQRFHYSNTNYALLALVVEKVSGMDFPAYLDKIIFKPLGMMDTYVYTPSRKTTAIPSYDARGREEPFKFLDEVYGDKNVYSTPRDLYKWDSALNMQTLFSKNTLEEAYRGYSFEQKGRRNYGLGWRLTDFGDGKKMVFHNGWWHGNNAVFCRYPNDSATVIVLGNRYNRKIYNIRGISDRLPSYKSVQEDIE